MSILLLASKIISVPPLTWLGSQTFNFTGADQLYTVPALANWLRFTVTGATSGLFYGTPGGDAASFNAIFHTSAVVGLSPGSVLSVMAGQRGLELGVYPASGTLSISVVGGYGFGGGGYGQSSYTPPTIYDAYTDGGGGLSGIFLGSSSILATDAARAVVIAGGASGYALNNNAFYAVGSPTFAGGQSTFQGQTGTSTPAGIAEWNNAGGGGGYNGGNASIASTSTVGHNGSSFVLGGAYSQASLATNSTSNGSAKIEWA